VISGVVEGVQSCLRVERVCPCVEIVFRVGRRGLGYHEDANAVGVDVNARDCKCALGDLGAGI